MGGIYKKNGARMGAIDLIKNEGYLLALTNLL